MNKVQLSRHMIGLHNFDTFYEHLPQKPQLFRISNIGIRSITQHVTNDKMSLPEFPKQYKKLENTNT